MSRRRYISTSMSIDKRLNLLGSQYGDFAALLYTWMVPHAEDSGRMNGDLDELMATVIPMRRDKSVDDVRAALEGMVALELVEWDGRVVTFPYESFYRHQSYIKQDNRRQTPENAGEQRETPSRSFFVSVSVSDPPPDPVSNAAAAAREENDPSADSPNDEPIRRVMDAWTNATGFTVTQQVADSMLEAIDDIGEEWTLEAIREAGEANARSWRYVKAVLERWKRDGRAVPDELEQRRNGCRYDAHGVAHYA